MEDELHPIIQDVQMTSAKATETVARVEDMENRLHHSNIRIVGMPEKSEGKHPVDFIETWLADTFGRNNLTPFFFCGKSPQSASPASSTRGQRQTILAEALTL